MSGTISYATDFGGKLEAVHKMLSAVADRNTDFLSEFLNLNEMVTSNKFEWVDKTLVGFKDALSSALATSTGTTITVSSGSNAPKRYIDGLTLIEIDDEVLLVNSTITVVTNASSYNVSRAQLGTTASSHANLAEVHLYANPRVEGFSAGRDDSQKGSRFFNYTQIFQREAKLSGTSQHVKAVGNEMALTKQIDDLTKEIVKELQMTLIRGRRYANDSTNYTDRKMGGLRWAAETYGTNQDKAGAAINKDLLEDIIETALSNGADARKIRMAVSTRQQRKLNELQEARVIHAVPQDAGKISNFVKVYDFGSSAQVQVRLVPDLKKDEIFVYQDGNISVHPMEGRAWVNKPLPEDGDFVREMILGEFTAVFRNPRETLYRYYGLAV
jgi:hypothetical protein